MELNEKLARFAGFEYSESRDVWHWPEEHDYNQAFHPGRLSLPDFTNSLDALFKWVVPKLPEAMEIILSRVGSNWLATLWGMCGDITDIVVKSDSPAEALAEAIEQYIDSMEEE